MTDNLIKLKTMVLKATKNIVLKSLKEEDITEDYINWMNDSEITRYTEQRFEKHDFKSISSFVRKMSMSEKNLLLGIFFNNKHIGSIKIGSINLFHNTAELSFLIGNKNFWRKGVATLAIKMALNICFKKLNLYKITAGVYAENIASIRALERNGFSCEGKRKKQFLHDKGRMDGLIYGKLFSDKYKKS